MNNFTVYDSEAPTVDGIERELFNLLEKEAERFDSGLKDAYQELDELQKYIDDKESCSVASYGGSDFIRGTVKKKAYQTKTIYSTYKIAKHNRKEVVEINVPTYIDTKTFNFKISPKALKGCPKEAAIYLDCVKDKRYVVEIKVTTTVEAYENENGEGHYFLSNQTKTFSIAETSGFFNDKGKEHPYEGHVMENENIIKAVNFLLGN
jgi:hypothetical protein